MKEKIKVLLVGENGFERRALHGFLEELADAHVIAEAQDSGEALAALARAPPDMVIADLPYDLETGLSLVRTIRSLYPGLPVMVLASHREQVFADHAMEAGAAGYMLFREISDRLPFAMDRLCHGGQYVSSCA